MTIRTHTGSARTALRRRGVTTLALLCAWSTAGVYAAEASLPSSPLGLSGQNREAVRSVLPEGWAFFTASPREDDVLLWERPAGERSPEGRWTGGFTAQASAGEFFGARRLQRAKKAEAGALMSGALERGARWLTCPAPAAPLPLRDTVRDCADAATGAVRVANASAHPRVCGTVLFSRQEPLPWTWARHGVDEGMPVRILPVEVTC
ncbi:SdpA family antimicrobial peptide system protein [Streptomyces pratensis]|uniref:SdpA family antimicrobial peptide system protein n=1 Tax=Streptomyces pratensis TaxID=1169025 RepID=UPI0037B293D3